MTAQDIPLPPRAPDMPWVEAERRAARARAQAALVAQWMALQGKTADPAAKAEADRLWHQMDAATQQAATQQAAQAAVDDTGAVVGGTGTSGPTRDWGRHGGPGKAGGDADGSTASMTMADAWAGGKELAGQVVEHGVVVGTGKFLADKTGLADVAAEAATGLADSLGQRASNAFGSGRMGSGSRTGLSHGFRGGTGGRGRSRGGGGQSGATGKSGGYGSQAPGAGNKGGGGDGGGGNGGGGRGGPSGSGSEGGNPHR